MTFLVSLENPKTKEIEHYKTHAEDEAEVFVNMSAFVAGGYAVVSVGVVED